MPSPHGGSHTSVPSIYDVGRFESSPEPVIRDGTLASWARTEQLDRLGARYTEQRVVERGKVITAAGVSSGIDMTLTLLDRVYGPALAQSVRPGIEYDPQPPFDAGSPSKAPADIVDLAKAALDIRATTGPSEVTP